ncbi:DsbA family oxidoreductase [Paenibacillus sp. SYP-B3998]|uniref:DsbA family oxidoreductase n=1 Tax=Paenibacillus sp. SYP-B3998 TaxID=2678564 RepID=A0A6G4A382_9BACL|nr:DsbA family oxidoreductase [Paenibacillus sp. SYP-B3998]NEW08394.1 DsbA family oxidoreductase [Paenibacillus sp. SYP-B3998]
MQVEIWSDIMCPFCYIGKRRFEEALEQFAQRDQVQIVYKSFQLDASSPKDVAHDVHDMLANKYGMSREEAIRMNDQLTVQAKALGLDYQFDTMILTNTLDAHRLIHYAAQYGKSTEVTELLFKAYFTDSKHVGQAATLAAIGAQAGLDSEAIIAMLASEQFVKEVQADQEEGARLGVQGVPFYVINRKYAISGAQSPAVFLDTLEKAWYEAHPLIDLTPSSGSADEMCTDGVCGVNGVEKA